MALAERIRPDVILMDVQKPGMNAIEPTRRITDMGIDSRVLILTNYALDAYIFEGLRAGACGSLVKDIQPIELLRSIRVPVDGHAFLSPAEASRAGPRPARHVRLRERRSGSAVKVRAAMFHVKRDGDRHDGRHDERGSTAITARCFT